jgi:hypothetical protein
VEDGFEFFGIDANAGVADGDGDGVAAGGKEFDFGVEADVALVGEFDGVACKVEEDLANAKGIAVEGAGSIGGVGGSSARTRISWTTSERTRERSMGARSMLSLPASMREKSRTSLMSARRDWADWAMVSE